MSEEQKTTDPALIPAEIYSAEGELVHVNSDMFVSSAQLDKMLPMNMRQQLVQKMDELVQIVHQARDFAVAHTGRRNAAVGKGFRNYGFMMASNQSMNNFPELAPNFINLHDFNDVVEDYLFARDVAERMLSITNDVRDIMNLFGNMGYDFALAYYANVRSIATRTGNETARSVFEILHRFFARRRTPNTSDGEPTEAQVERDLRALLHGHKDGEITVKAHAAQAAAGSREVMDNTYKPTAAALSEKIVCAQCSAENEGHAKFCINCGGKLQ